MTLDVDSLKKVIVGHEECKSGKHCKFFVVGSVGIKAYRTAAKAELAYRRQKLGSQYQCAPPVGDLVLVYITNRKQHPTHKYGYETSICEPIFGKLDENLDRYRDLHDKIGQIMKQERSFDRDTMRCKPPEKVNADFRSSNLGIWDGKVVLIDWT